MPCSVVVEASEDPEGPLGDFAEEKEGEVAVVIVGEAAACCLEGSRWSPEHISRHRVGHRDPRDMVVGPETRGWAPRCRGEKKPGRGPLEHTSGAGASGILPLEGLHLGRRCFPSLQ